MFFIINLPLSHQLDLLMISSIYLDFLLTEIQRKFKQTKIYLTFFFALSLKRNHEPLKVAAAKLFLFSAYVIGKTCFDECFKIR